MKTSRNSVILIGYRGTGKTTVARLLAERLGWSWTDADAYLEARHGRTIREIFADEGEAGFRDKEAAILTELAGRERHVLATGGGVILRADNRALIRRSGFVVWLTADAATIHARLQADPTTGDRRPHLTAACGLAEIEQLLADRGPLYRECADLTVDSSGRSPDDIVHIILAALTESNA